MQLLSTNCIISFNTKKNSMPSKNSKSPTFILGLSKGLKQSEQSSLHLADKLESSLADKLESSLNPIPIKNTLLSCSLERTLLNIATFDSYGEETTGRIILRNEILGGMNNKGELYNVFEDEKLDFLSLPETWNIDSKRLLFSSFNSSNYTIFETPPSPLMSTNKCKNACINDSITAYNITMPLNKWVRYCSLTPIQGSACVSYNTEWEFQNCLITNCPYVIDIVNYINFECSSCVSNSRANESFNRRINRCTSSYNFNDALNCKYIFNGGSDIPVITRGKASYQLYVAFPEDINVINYCGFVHTRFLKKGFTISVFNPHPVTSFENVPTTDDPVFLFQRAQIKYLLKYIKQNTQKSEIVVIIGDINNGPGSLEDNITAVWEENYKLILDSGYEDVFSSPVCTFGCNLYQNSPTRQFLDHAFIRNNKKGVYLANNKVIFSTQSYPIGLVQNISLSDHYGIRASICY